MHRRTNKHSSKRERFDDKVTKIVKDIKSRDLESNEERVMPVKNMKHLLNWRISVDPSVDLGEAVRLLELVNKEYDIHSKVVLCSNCSKKIGVKRCARCLSTSTVRYCSRDCQLAAWPAHRKCCGVIEAVDVE